MNKSTIILVIGLFISLDSVAQQNNIWYFGLKGGLDFNAVPGSPSPVAIGNSAMITNEVCSTICDKIGQLLFYSIGNVSFGQSQRPNKHNHPSGKQHTISIGANFPLGNFSSTHIIGVAINYSWSNHRFGRMDV